MGGFKIDHHALALDLEAGIRQTDTIAAHVSPKRYLLRNSICGLVSTGIDIYLENQNIPSELHISSPDLIGATKCEHVFNVLDSDSDDPLVVDGTYSQFFGLAGLSYPYVHNSGEDLFPEEKVISFRFSERKIVADWMAGICRNFQSRKKPLKSKYTHIGTGPLQGLSKHKMRDELERIWDLESTQDYLPPAHVKRAGAAIAGVIRPGLIKVIR